MTSSIIWFVYATFSPLFWDTKHFMKFYQDSNTESRDRQLKLNEILYTNRTSPRRSLGARTKIVTVINFIVI